MRVFCRAQFTVFRPLFVLFRNDWNGPFGLKPFHRSLHYFALLMGFQNSARCCYSIFRVHLTVGCYAGLFSLQTWYGMHLIWSRCFEWLMREMNFFLRGTASSNKMWSWGLLWHSRGWKRDRLSLTADSVFYCNDKCCIKSVFSSVRGRCGISRRAHRQVRLTGREKAVGSKKNVKGGNMLRSVEKWARW